MNTQTEEIPDFYDLLACSDTANGKELQKSFRKQAFKYHPDKNPTPEAGARFHLLTIALETLTDTEKRRKYDSIRTQKAEAQKRRDRIEGERRAWIDELEKGENAASLSEHDRKRKRQAQETREEELSRTGARLRAELAENLRAKHKPSDSEAPDKKTRSADSATSAREFSGQNEPEIFSPKDKTLKIRFRGHGSTIRLRSLFSRFGEVKEVVYRPSEKKTQSALIEYAQIHSAYAASTSSFRGEDGLDIREISWAYGQIPELRSLDGTDLQQAKPAKLDATGLTSSNQEDILKTNKKTFSFSATKKAENGGQVQVGSEYESLVLLKMKQRQKEKERAAAAI